MKLVVVSGHKSFDKFKPTIRRVAGFLAKQLKQEKTYLEVYLVGKEFMYKNVLAFPAPKNFPRPDIKLKSLGEVYLNPQYIKENGEDLVFMLIHGFLHLLGYDHKKENDRISMESKEKELLKLLGK
ncbi:MAG: rRNA maturation RNase YbeY [bacterium]|nr:rRNA maturation RNase YbeY [bacterium]